VERYATEVKRLLGVLEKRLEGREYLIDDGYSIADMATAPWIYTLDKFYHGEEKLEVASFTKVVAWKARCLTRPATARGMKVASII
jgi:glutathione S-transferase